jgi:hypothetical protein
MERLYPVVDKRQLRKVEVLYCKPMYIIYVFCGESINKKKNLGIHIPNAKRPRRGPVTRLCRKTREENGDIERREASLYCNAGLLGDFCSGDRRINCGGGGLLGCRLSCFSRLWDRRGADGTNIMLRGRV